MFVKRPMFSCVVPVKGKRPYFGMALDSLRAQEMGDELEIIVQDGDLESDRGQSDALNRGFAKARGEWFFWLNADDVLLPGALRSVARRLDCSVEWVAGNQIFIDAGGRVVRCVRGNGWHDGLYRQAVPHVNGPSAFFRRELFEKVGGFDTSLHFCMDWDLWIRFKQTGARFLRIDRYLWAQRRWAGSKTQRAKPLEEEKLHRSEVMRMLEKNAFRPTMLGASVLRLWRTLNGNYLRSAWDTLLRRGCFILPRAAILVKHRAPYRDPVIRCLEETGKIDSFAWLGKDDGHADVGFATDARRFPWCGLHRYAFVVWPAYHPWPFTLALVLSALCGCRYAVSSDTNAENGNAFARMIKRFIFRRAEFVWVPGMSARHFLETHYAIGKERIVSGLYVVDRDEVVAVKEFGGSLSPRRFLMVANDVPVRRMDVLVEAFRRIRTREQTLVLCGKGCRRYAGGGVEAIEGVSWRELPRLYAEADVYVHNGAEQYSTAVQIAALMGMPIVCAKKVGIVADLGEDVLVPVSDGCSVEAWSAALLKISSMDAHSRQKLGVRVRQAAAAFDIRAVAREVVSRLNV